MNLEIMNQFFEAAMLDKTHNPWCIRRKPGQLYADVMIVNCENPLWWYKPFIGISCLALLRFKNYGYSEFLHEVIFVRLTGTKMHTGRSAAAGDIIIL